MKLKADVQLKTEYSDIHREIIEKCRKGDPESHYKLYGLYSKAMFNICCRIMSSREEAEDMLQESFTDAFTKLGSFRFESSFGSWLKQITINKCINELKRKKADLSFTDNMAPFESPVEETGPDPETIEMEVARVKKAMELLPHGYRIIFSLYLLEGYDHGEIAEILNISESTSKSQYLRAKRRLLEILKNNGNER